MTSLAPCIAVVGPANAGKTTLLHQLDEKLQRLVPSVLVIKGNPDGTGRYQLHAPELRRDPTFQTQVKGRWGSQTIERICEWIDHGRRNLALALLDFGGKHDSENHRMLERCSHYLLVSRNQDHAGAESWDTVCRQNGLARVGWLRSVGAAEDPPAVLQHPPAFEATFRWDAGPGDHVNDASLNPLADLLASLSRSIPATPYIDLKLAGEWTEDMIPSVAGRARDIRELAERVKAVVFGGRAPIWAYLAGLRCALEANPDARVFFFDPRQPERLVEIPPKPAPADFPPDILSLQWDLAEDGTHRLCFAVATPDKFLPPHAAQNLAGAPHFGTPPSDVVGLFGPLPVWVYGAYARWLLAAGVRGIDAWDARMRKFVHVWF
jgi:hypothetical protein